jgi:hypothetical protein
LPFLVIVLLIVFGQPLALWYTARTLPKREPSLLGVQSRTVGDDALQVQSPGAHLTLEWTAIPRVVETPEVFLFFFNRKSAHYLPKRAIPAGEIDQVRQLIRSKVGDRFEG